MDQSVVISVHPTIVLAAIKKQLAEERQDSQILEKGSFVKYLPNGNALPVSDTASLGTRRLLGIAGAIVLPTPEEAGPLSLDDFEGFDESFPLSSPRSLQACRLDGVLPEELFYASEELFEEPGVSKRVQQLRHDFFEVFRQDTLSMLRSTRRRLCGERADAEESKVEVSSPSSRSRPSSSTLRDGTPHGVHGVHGTVSQTTKAKDASRCTGLGGTWGLALEFKTYSQTFNFLEAVKPFLDWRSMGDQPLVSAHCNRWGSTMSRSRPCSPSSSPANSRENMISYFEFQADAVKKAAAEISGLALQLKRLPAEKNHETIGGLVLRTEAETVQQRRRNSLTLAQECAEATRNVNACVRAAKSQKDRAEKHYLEVRGKQSRRDASFQASRSPWPEVYKELNESKVEWALQRKEFCSKRKEALHQNWSQSEEAKNEAVAKMVAQDPVWMKRTQTMRDLRKIHFARRWLNKRIQWSLHDELARVHFERKVLSLAKRMDTEDHIKELQTRKEMCADIKRELKELRLVMKAMVAEREKRRQDCRRQDVSKELAALAHQFNKGLTAVAAPRVLQNSPGGTGKSQRQRPASTASRQLGTAPLRSFPRFDWGRFGVESMSKTWSASG